ncbi:MAG: hypothetical protein AVDCRST_MAG71-1337 [uncultured Lysobacter sp.]|uniref:Peptidase S8 n=1 Tax=uncultured Lysobacter sp. TaxID=271060 RepID=A0A6J4L2U4_9GAMM|nr:MAG: hypothetical protein AVDCRST_MAG71-1337 [uncultured Lysobacter sp.]
MVALANQSADGVQWLESEEPTAVVASDEAQDESPARWFVELSGSPMADGGSLTDVRAQKKAFRDAARANGVKYIEHFAYDNLFNGFSITVSRSQLSTLTRLSGVKAIYPVETIQMPESSQVTPEMFSALAMTGADIAQNQLGLTGRGIKVAVMDTGVDIDHPDFGGTGTNGTTPFPNARIIAGYDFVGDAFNGPSATPAPDANPDDCGGHGTHVAGIIGANGVVKGVAPDVKIGAYRVFGCEGSTTADIMVAAMERAQADGMHVLNMSIGSTYQWPQYPTAKAASRLVNKGMVVVASAGNSGATGMYSAGAPSVGDKVISVASFDNTHIRQTSFTVSPDNVAIGYNPATGAAPTPTSGTAPLRRTGTATSTADGCSALPAGSLAGHVALIRRGTCPFHTKALNAQNAGATGVVLYDNAPGAPLSPTVTGTPSINIPVVFVIAAAGEMLNSRLASGPVELTWTGNVSSFPNPGGGRLSSFTAYGMSPDLQLKPDIGGPGGAIYSTYPLEKNGGYATLSGTSMSSPHVAGTAALLLQAAPKTPAQAVGRILQNTAEPKVWSGSPGSGLLDIVHRQGAGMVRIDQAITTATRVEPGKISLGEGEAGATTRTLQLRNGGSTPVTYTLSSVNAVSTGPSTFTPQFLLPATGVSFGTSTITLEAGASASVGVTFTPPNVPQGSQYGGYVVLTPNDGSAVLRVPFAGYAGDYQARQVLTPTPSGFPWLAKLADGSYSNQAGGATYSMAGGDVPYFLAHFDHQAQVVRLDVTDVNGKTWHNALKTEHYGRNSTATGFFAFTWDGVTTAGGKTYTVPNGRYIVKLSVLKALGDATNPAHWETWNSPVITIAR